MNTFNVLIMQQKRTANSEWMDGHIVGDITIIGAGIGTKCNKGSITVIVGTITRCFHHTELKAALDFRIYVNDALCTRLNPHRIIFLENEGITCTEMMMSGNQSFLIDTELVSEIKNFVWDQSKEQHGQVCTTDENHQVILLYDFVKQHVYAREGITVIGSFGYMFHNSDMYDLRESNILIRKFAVKDTSDEKSMTILGSMLESMQLSPQSHC